MFVFIKEDMHYYNITRYDNEENNKGEEMNIHDCRIFLLWKQNKWDVKWNFTLADK